MRLCVLSTQVGLAAEPALARLAGVWENATRIVAIAPTADAMRFSLMLVHKPYYAYVYERVAVFSLSSLSDARADVLPPPAAQKAERVDLVLSFEGRVRVQPLVLCRWGDALFCSFFQRVSYGTRSGSVSSEQIPVRTDDPLFGFWIEEGSAEALRAYSSQAPGELNAFFFTEANFYRFRYWRDDALAFAAQRAYFTADDGVTYEIPQYVQRGAAVYSCTTGRSRVVRNFQTGTYEVRTSSDGSKRLMLRRCGAGPGSYAVGAVYPRQGFLDESALALRVDGQFLAIGEPFLRKSVVHDVTAFIDAHNARKRAPRAPLLVPDF